MIDMVKQIENAQLEALDWATGAKWRYSELLQFFKVTVYFHFK